MNSAATLLNRCPGPVPGGPGAFASRRSAGLQTAMLVRTHCVSPTWQFGPIHNSSLIIHLLPPKARRAGIFVASASQKQSKLRRSGIALSPHRRTGRFPISHRGGRLGRAPHDTPHPVGRSLLRRPNIAFFHPIRRSAVQRPVAGARVCDPQRPPCKSRPGSSFGCPLPSVCCGSPSRTPSGAAGARVCDPQQTPCKFKPENCFDFPENGSVLDIYIFASGTHFGVPSGLARIHMDGHGGKQKRKAKGSRTEVFMNCVHHQG